MKGLRLVTIGIVAAACVMAASCSSCRSAPAVEPAVYREAVVAFHTALAAIDTSQEVLAREKLDRVVALVPQEPAGWANLALLLLRQQENAAARTHLARAAELSPDTAAIVRLQALVESREGNLVESTRLWRHAVELDPGDLKSAYALAQETERLGGADADAEAQRVLERLLARTDNLPARLDVARLAAKRGDGSALTQAIAPLSAAASIWPAAAQERLAAVQAATSTPRAAATQVAFLRNLLAREVAYRRALAQVSTPLDAIGEPIPRFLVLPAPSAAPAPADGALTFSVTAVEGWPEGIVWAGAAALADDRPEALLAVDAEGVLAAGGTRVAAFAGSQAARHGAAAVVAADLDYDYRTDLVLAGGEGLRLLVQQQDGTFRETTAASGLPAAALGAPAHGGWPADVDLDGDLDIVVGTIDGPAFVARNNGDGTFAQQQPFGPCLRTRGFAWADFDGEGVPDPACLDASGVLQVFANLRGGAFEAIAVPNPTAPLLAVAAADVSADGRVDLVALAGDGAVVALTFADPAPADPASATPRWLWRPLGRLGAGLPGATAESTRLLVADLDNNGGLDLIIAAAGQTHVLLASAGGTFSTAGAPVPLATHAVADLDEDGRLELVGVSARGQLATARSSGQRTYHWQRLRLRAATATGDQRVNSFGIGGEVEVRTGLHVQTHRISSPVLHIGLGEATGSDVVRIVWPNGVLQSEFAQKADATIRASQRLKGSCPWLFAWNGREMGFVTDLIWRSPLGLRINAHATADASMTEDWVKVGGSQLVPRDGAYDLRITAELWETHFFDLVSLAIVDHPIGTEVFVDERFVMPAPVLAPVVTGPLQAFERVTDDSGRDVSSVVAARDDTHLDFAGRGRYQGITRPHAIEIVVPDEAPRQGPLYLVAQGWVHPTDSSINVAIAQGAHPRPQGLSLEVADAQGRFRTVKSNLGFPSGKDKTILIEMADALPAAGVRRVRLTTNLEIFWDRLAWAVGRPDVHVTPQQLPLAAAHLRYRGFSTLVPHSPSTPERPRYVLEGTAPRWLDLEGYHTRFGDVQPLLSAVDDRYVIMNAGDELALRFPEARAAAPGMVRDFVVIGDGWVKDGDFNTTFSRSVLPLPTHASGRYDRAPRRLEDDPVYLQHADDFATYHTRYVTSDARRALRQAVPGRVQ